MRLKRDRGVAEALGSVIVATAGGEQRMQGLPLKFLPGWLFGITASRVRPALRDKILRYQRDCYDVLWDAFKADILPTPPVPSTASGAALAVEIAVGAAVTGLYR